jgi:dTDP-4-dehydrorhamnose reductase
MDLADLKKVREVIRTIKPTLIINPAAYTDVEKAESEPELAMRINSEVPTVMAEEARKSGSTMTECSRSMPTVRRNWSANEVCKLREPLI